jgi:alanine-synthesizing transaminase
VFLEERKRRYEAQSNIAYEILKGVPGIKVNRTNGAFYMSVVFEDGLLTADQTLPIENAQVRDLVKGLVAAPGVSLDKRFVYYLLASTGICVVPLSSFFTPLMGIRVTLLEQDDEEFTRVFRTLGDSIGAYLGSSKRGTGRQPVGGGRRVSASSTSAALVEPGSA